MAYQLGGTVPTSCSKIPPRIDTYRIRIQFFTEVTSLYCEFALGFIHLWLRKSLIFLIKIWYSTYLPNGTYAAKDS